MDSKIKNVVDRWKKNPSDRTEFIDSVKKFQKGGDWRAIVQLYGAAALSDVEYDRVELANEALKVLKKLLEVTKDEEKNLLLVAVGDMFRYWKHDKDSSLAAYQQAFNACRTNTICLQRARHVYADNEDYRRVVGLLEHEIKIVEVDEQRASLILQLAQVNADCFHDYALALQLLDTLEGLPHDEQLAHELRSLYDSGTSLEEFLQVLVEQASKNQTTSPVDSANDFLQAAQMEISRPTGNIDRAISYVARATNLAPTNTDARRLLRELNHEREHPVWPADEPLPAEFLPDYDPSTKFEGEGPEVTAVLSREEAERIGREFGDTQTAEFVRSQFQEEITNPNLEAASEEEKEEKEEAKEEAEGASEEEVKEEKVEEKEEVAESQEAAAEEGTPAEESESPTEEASEEEEEEDDDEEEEESSEEEGEIAADEAHLQPVTRELRKKREQYLREGDVEGAIQMYEKKIKKLRRKPGEDEVMADLANLFWKDADDWEKAEYYFKRLKLLNANHPDIEKFYTEFYERGGEWRKLLVLLMNNASEAKDPEEKRAYTRRLAALGEGPMNSTKTAIDAWRAFQKEFPEDEEAASELKRLYKEEGKWTAYIDILRGEYDQLDDSDRGKKIAILEEIKDVYANEIRIEPMLISTLQELLELDPENRPALQQLRDHLHSGRRYTDLAELLENQAKKAEESGDLASASEYFLEVADMWQNTLRNVSAAIPHLERVLELDPSNVAVIDRTIEVYSSRRDYVSVVRLKRRKAHLVGEDDAAQLLEEAAKIAQDRIRDPQLIAEVIEEQLALTPDDFDAMKTLRQIYDRSDNYQKQVEIRRSMLDQHFGDDQELLREIAHIATNKLNDDEMAVDAWTSLLERNPSHEEAVQALTLVYVKRHDFEHLQDLYLRQAKPEELFEILDAAAGSSEDKSVKANVYERMADVAERQLSDSDRTIMSLEYLKEYTDAPLEPSKRLLALYGKVGDKAQQIEQLQFLIEHDGEEARPEYLRQLRELYVDVGDPENALKTSAKLLLLDPRSEEVYQRSVEIADTDAGKVSLVKFLDRISSSEQGKDQELVDLNERRVGRLLVELKQWPEAVERLEKLSQSFPDDLDVKRDLEVAYGGAGQPEKQVEILESIIEHKREAGATPQELVNDLTRIADIERNALNQPDQALQSYLDILELVPEHLSSLTGLEEIYRAREDWVEVLNVLERKRDALPFDSSDERLDVLYSMAEINVEHLENRHRALEIAREILSAAPQSEKTIQLVENLYDDPDVGYEASTLLETYIREADSRDRLVRNLEVRTKWSQDNFEKIDLLDRLINLALNKAVPSAAGEEGEGSAEGEGASDVAESVEEKAERLRAAFKYARRQLELDPSREETWERLDSLMAEGEELSLSFSEDQTFYDALEQTYSEITQGDIEPQTRVALTRKLAKLRISGYDPEGAIEAFKVLHEIDPYDLEAVDGLITNYKQINDHDNLVSMMAVKASLLSDPAEQSNWYLQAADLADEVLQDPERTEKYLKEVLYLQPDRFDIHRRLISFYEREEEWEKLAEQYRTYIEIEPDQERKESSLTALAKIHWDQLRDDDKALETYRELLILTDGSKKTLEEVFLFDDHLKEYSEDNPVRLDLVELLEPILREKDNKASLSRVLKTRLIFTDDPFSRAEQLDEYSRLRELLGSPEDALTASREALLTVSDNETRRERFQSLCQKQEVPEYFVETYQAAIDNLSDPFLAAKMLVQKAKWETEKLDRIDDAIASLERARSFDETNLVAAQQLDKLYETTQDYEKLAGVLRSKALLEEEPDHRIKSYRRLAHLQDEILDHREDAISSWGEVLALVPTDTEAINALERLYEMEERWVDLTEILNRKIDAARDEQVRFDSMRKLAAVFEYQLDDYATSVTELQRAHQLRPGNTEVLFELRRLLFEHEQWAELDEVIQKLLATEGLQRTPELKAELLLQQGDIRSIEMFEIERAIPTYLRVLRFDYPEYKEKAIEALERISNDEAFLDAVAEPLSSYNVANNRWESEVDLTHKLANQSAEPERRSLLFQRLADLYDLHLQDSRGAFDSLLSAWNETPLNFNLYLRAKEKVPELHAEMDMAEAINNQLVQVAEPKKNIELRLDLANLYEHSLENRIEAEQQYREVLLLDPSNEVAGAALENLLVTDERWFDLLELYENRYQNAAARHDQEAVADHLLQMANIQENMLNDPIATVDAYRRVLDERPGNEPARNAILRLLREQDRWAELAEFIEENIEWFEAGEKRLRKLELASIQGEQLSNPMLSLDHLVELLTPGSAYSLEPATNEFAQATETVENYLHSESYQYDTLLRNKAAKLLLPIYEARQEWQSIAETREIIARTSEERDEIRTNLLEAANTYQYRLQNFDEARRLRYELLSSNPDRIEFLQALGELCFTQDDWISFADFLEDLLTDNPTLEPEIHNKIEHALVEVHEIRLDDINRAIELVKRALENDPENQENIETLERLLTRIQDWAELGRLFRRRADFASNDEERTTLLRKLAFLHENFMEERGEAIDIFFEILNSSEGTPAAERAAADLIRLLRREERWFDLVDLLQQMQEAQPSANYALHLAEIYIDHLKNYEDAVDVLEQLLINDPNDYDVRRQLRGVQRHLESLDEDYAQLELRIVEMLLHYKPASENVKRTQELLEIRVEILDDDFERAETYLKIAAISEQRPSTSDRINALAALCKAYQIRPYDNELFQRLSSLAERTETWERVPGMLLPGLRNLDEPEAQVQLLTAVAWVYRERMKDITSAIVALQSVIDLEPSNQDALDALEDSYRSNLQWKELTRILEIRVKEENDGVRRQQSLENLAKLNHTVTNRLPRAIENYEELRTVDPSNIEYIQALEDLYRTTEDWNSLEELLSDHSSQVLEPEKQVEVLTRLADVQKNHTDNIDGAIVTNVMIVDIDPDNEGALESLLELYEKAARWDELLDALQKRIEHVEDPAKRLELKIKQCRIKAFETGDIPDALVDLEAILRRDRFCDEAQTLLRELTLRKEGHEEALRILVDNYRESEQWTHLQALFESLLGDLDKTDFREERREVFLTLIVFYAERESVAEEQGQQLPSELDSERVAALAFEEFPTDSDILAAYQEITSTTDAKARRLNVLQRVLDENELDPYDARPTKALLATTYADLGENEIAIKLWTEVLELDAYDAASLAALDELYVKEEKYDQLVDILEREVGVAEPERVADLRCRLAYLYETKVDQKQKALDIYAEVLATEPSQTPALEGLVRLYEDRDYIVQAVVPLSEHLRAEENWETLAHALDGALPFLEPSDKIRTRRELIEIFLEKLQSPSDAFVYLCEAIGDEPNDYTLQGQAEELVDQVNGYDALAAKYAEIESEIDDPMRRVEILTYSANHFYNELSDFEHAEKLYHTVLEVDSENQNALLGLEYIARSQEDRDKLIEVLKRKAESIYEMDVQVAAYGEVAKLYAEQERYDEAIETYRKALALEPSNVALMDELGVFLGLEGRYEELLELLEQESRFIDEEERRFHVLVRAGQVADGNLNNNQQAIRFYEEAHSILPTDVDTMVALEHLYTAEGLTDQRRQVLEKLVSSQIPVEQRVQYLSALGTILDESYNDFDGAIGYLSNAYELSKTLNTDTDNVAFDRLQDLYARNQRWEDLNNLFEQRLAELREDQVDEQIEIRARRADIVAKHLGDTEGAIQALNELLAISPQHFRTLSLLADLYGEVGDIHSQHETLTRLIQSATKKELQIEALRRRAKLYEANEQAAEAVADYVSIIEMEPNDKASIDRLKEIYSTFEAWEEYIKMLDFEITVASDNKAKLNLLCEGYDIAKTKLQNYDLMVLLLERMLEIKEDPEVMEKLIDAYISGGQTAKANTLIQEAITTLQAQRKMKDVVRYYHLQGKLAEQEGNDDGALHAYREAHAIDASYLPNLLSLGQLLMKHEEWDEALKIFQTLLLHQMNVKEKEDKIAIYYNLGVIRIHQGDDRRAKDMFKRVLSLDRNHEAAQKALEGLA